MPRRLLFTALVLGLILPAAATAAMPEIAAHIGFTTATFHMDDLSSEAQEGLAVGASVRLPLSDTFAIMPEIWYLQKGFKRGTLWEQIDLQDDLQTLTIPVLLSYWFPAVSADPRIYAGISADFVLKNEIARGEDPDQWYDVTDQTESLYWCLVVGGGARLFEWFDVDFRYQHGFTRVTNFDWDEFDDVIPVNQEFDDAYDRTWTLSVGYWF